MSYFTVTAFNLTDQTAGDVLQAKAMEQFACLGIEEFSLDEAAVDELLGARSYSGGDLPPEVIDEVDRAMHAGQFHYKFFFGGADAQSAKDFLEYVRTQYLCEAQIEEKADEDWNAEWKKHYGPIEVPGGLTVLPEWEQKNNQRLGRCIYIHPGMGFGTGSHETTFLCLKAMLGILPNLPSQASILDYGSGSGILGLSALLYFPNYRAIMVDIDPEAHRNCLQNMAINRIPVDRVDLLLVSERPETETYPLVFANILQNILHQERDYLIERTEIGGFLILSGLLRNQVDETLGHYMASEKMDLVEQEAKADWGCILLRKKS